MSSRECASEEALADLACDEIGARPLARVLVGGLGMGFTLARALGRLGPSARVVVAEIVPAVVRWNRGVLGEVSGFPLEDARVTVHEGDVADVIRSEAGAWDAILLDVDNGPTALTATTNGRLYSSRGLEAAFAALRTGGVLGVWSAAPDDAFTRRMSRAGFEVVSERLRSRGGHRGRRHVVWLGTRRDASPAPRPNRA